MRALLAAAVVVAFSGSVRAADPPLAEKFLHSSKLDEGEAVLSAVLRRHPTDDETRFGLGMVQFTNAVQKFGRQLHKYGVKTEEVAGIPFVRLPVPRNPNPTPINYGLFRKLFDDLYHDLGTAERTLAGVTDDTIKLRLRLAAVRFDFDGSGRGNDKFTDVLVKLLGQSPEFLRKDPDFLVCFDRGDVAWLRAYCHLLQSMIDVFLALDLREFYQSDLHKQFAKAEDQVGGDQPNLFTFRIKFASPERLGQFRKHMLQVCALNRETWKSIRAETDDDHEWLPNPKQKGVIGLPVRDEMIDGWLAAVAEVEELLEGKTLVPIGFLPNTNGKALNLKTLLDNPPAELSVQKLLANGPDAKYLEKGRESDFRAISRVERVFGNTLSVAYAAWFN
ncbi:MAG TPA: hypothetical protein VMZ71_17000 [Gemmataceae bacterium]|nr:hypothetical protein [Gemmataceae bacterium]